MGVLQPAAGAPHWRTLQRTHGRWGGAAVLLAALLAALLLVPLAAADDSPPTREEELMLSLRAQLWRGIAPLMVPLAGWHPVYRHSPCTWSLVTCNEQRHVVKIQLHNSDRSARQRLSEGEVHHWTSGSGGSPDGPGGLADSLRLPPELAQLEHLEELELVQHLVPWQGGFPREWLAPGAFPRLKRLVLGGQRLGGPLPHLAPGQLPALQALELQFYNEQQPARLPASWGASPRVLPQLQSLSVAMRLQAPLPASWAAGFRQLQELTLADPLLMEAIQRRAEVGPQRQPSAVKAAAEAWAAGGSAPSSSSRRLPRPAGAAAEAGGGSAVADAGDTFGQDADDFIGEDNPAFLAFPAWQAGAPAPAAAPSAGAAGASAPPQLPPAWANGFPLLRTLRVAGLNLTGPLPAPWVSASWPRLELLDLSHNRLHGPLPAQLFAGHPRLTHLWLDGNRFSGPLPAEWGASKAQVLSLMGNALSGPAFPPEWTLPGSLISLSHLLLSGNRGLGGELPPHLAWPNLRTLRLEGTGLQGSIPEAWCRAPFRLSLHHIWIRGTAISPSLPACINSHRDVGRLYLDVPDPEAQQQSGHNGQGGHATAAGAAAAAYPAASGGVQLDALGRRAPGWDVRTVGPAQPPQTAAAFMAAAVAVAAAAAVAAAGGLLYARQRRVWRQQQWQRLSGSECAEDGPALLAGCPGSPAPAGSDGSPEKQPAVAPATAHGPKAAHNGPQAAPAAAPALAEASVAALTARLAATVAAEPPTAAATRAAALLRAELEDWDGVVDLMPLEALPAALAQAAAQQHAAAGGAQAAQQQPIAASGGVTAPVATSAQEAMQAAGCSAAAAAAAGRVEEITPLGEEAQQQQVQPQWGYAQQQPHQPQWHSLAPPQQAQPPGLAGSCAGPQAGLQSCSQGSPAGPASAQTSSCMTSSRGVHSVHSGAINSRGAHSVHSGAINSRGVHSARSTRSTQSSSSMGCDGGQWNLQSTLLLLSPGELTLERNAQGQPVLLGHGRAAAVCLGRLGGKPVAVKAYELSPGLKPEAAWRQVTKSRGCLHPRVAEVHGAAIQGRLLLLSTELLPLGSLREALQQRELRRELRWSTGGYQVAVDVAEALVFLHTQLRLRHGGLSSSNVLLSDELRASVADLGVAQLLAKHCGGGGARSAAPPQGDHATGRNGAASTRQGQGAPGAPNGSASAPAGGSSEAGPLAGVPAMAAAGPEGVAQMYAAPEQLAGQRCSTAADMYSFGILLAEIATQRPGHRRGEWRMPRAGHDCPQIIVELIAACLSPDARQRPTAEKALQVLLLTDGW